MNACMTLAVSQSPSNMEGFDRLLTTLAEIMTDVYHPRLLVKRFKTDHALKLREIVSQSTTASCRTLRGHKTCEVRTRVPCIHAIEGSCTSVSVCSNGTISIGCSLNQSACSAKRHHTATRYDIYALPTTPVAE